MYNSKMKTCLENTFISMLYHKTEWGRGEAGEKGGLKLFENSFQGRRY